MSELGLGCAYFVDDSGKLPKIVGYRIRAVGQNWFWIENGGYATRWKTRISISQLHTSEADALEAYAKFSVEQRDMAYENAERWDARAKWALTHSKGKKKHVSR